MQAVYVHPLKIFSGDRHNVRLAIRARTLDAAVATGHLHEECHSSDCGTPCLTRQPAQCESFFKMVNVRVLIHLLRLNIVHTARLDWVLHWCEPHSSTEPCKLPPRASILGHDTLRRTRLFNGSSCAIHRLLERSRIPAAYTTSYLIPGILIHALTRSLALPMGT